MTFSVAVVLVASLAGQPGDRPPFLDSMGKATTYYYKSPDPTLGPTLLKDLLRKENIEHPWFAMREENLTLFGSVLGDIAKGNPKIVREYEAAFPDAPLPGRHVIVQALMNCGDKETIKQIEGWVADPQNKTIRPELEALQKHLENPARKHVRDRPAREPLDLDRLWGNFFITGEYAPIARILDVFDLPEDNENEILKRLARWSLGSNLQQHPKLTELVQDHVKERPTASRKVVEELTTTLKALVGRWTSQDADKEPLVFGKDNTFECGFVKEKGAWVMAKGQYTLSPDGKIRTQAQYEGSTISRIFTLKDSVIRGSRGPNPNVEWKQDKP
jgi:hypothetical protein